MNDNNIQQGLQHVTKGQRITADAWNQLVDAVNGVPDVSIRRTRRAKSVPLNAPIFLVRLHGDWIQAAQGNYKTTVNPVVNGQVQEEVLWDVYAPASEIKPSGEKDKDCFYVIFRENRYEYLSNISATANSKKVKVVKTVSSQPTSVIASIDGITKLQSVSLESSDTAEAGSVPYVSSITCNDGELIVTTKYMKAVIIETPITPTTIEVASPLSIETVEVLE